jgi:hypothetical protein
MIFQNDMCKVPDNKNGTKTCSKHKEENKEYRVA